MSFFEYRQSYQNITDILMSIGSIASASGESCDGFSNVCTETLDSRSGSSDTKSRRITNTKIDGIVIKCYE